MGTFWRVSVIGISQKYSNNLRNKIQTQLDTDEKLLSTYRSDSVLMCFNKSNSINPWLVEKNIADIISKSIHIGYQTNGAVDITIGSLINLWGFGANKKPVTMPNQNEIDVARSISGLGNLKVINQSGKYYLIKKNPNLFINLSAVGEGYAADHLAELMVQEGISRYLISVGGTLVGRGMNEMNKPWRVAIQKPTDIQNIVQDIVSINGYGISTSGSYHNYYKLENKHVSHIIDPDIGYPINHRLVSVTVIASTALEADALSTAMMVLGLKKAQEKSYQEEIAIYTITKEGNSFKIWISPKFKEFLLK